MCINWYRAFKSLRNGEDRKLFGSSYSVRNLLVHFNYESENNDSRKYEVGGMLPHDLAIGEDMQASYKLTYNHYVRK